MKLLILCFLILAGIAVLQVQSQVSQPVPPLFHKNRATAFVWRPNSGSQCKFQCKRRYIGDWSRAYWGLYLKLWAEANKRGYLEALTVEHNYDCNNRGCLFHSSKMLTPWHRIFVAHYEQLLQKIDHEINPGRASRSGEFCIGYWEWGYQVPFSNNLQDAVYKYIFNAQALGSLPSGFNNIPDGALKNAQVNGNFLTRAPSLGSNNWGTAAVASCLQLRDIEGGGNGGTGFRPCIEFNAHNSIHNSVGGSFASFRSPQDPLFFLHHGMIDYTWWLWQQSNGNIIPNDWSSPLVRPYNTSGWTMKQTLNYKNLCYTYVKPRQVTRVPKGKKYQRRVASSVDIDGSGVGRKLVGEAPQVEVQATVATLTTDVKSLQPVQQLVVEKILNASEPMAIPKDQFGFLTMHAESPEQAEENYQNHLRAVQLAKDFQNSIKTFFAPTKETIANPATNPNNTDVKYAVAQKIGALTLSSEPSDQHTEPSDT